MTRDNPYWRGTKPPWSEDCCKLKLWKGATRPLMADGSNMDLLGLSVKPRLPLHRACGACASHKAGAVRDAERSNHGTRDNSRQLSSPPSSNIAFRADQDSYLLEDCPTTPQMSGESRLLPQPGLGLSTTSDDVRLSSSQHRREETKQSDVAPGPKATFPSGLDYDPVRNKIRVERDTKPSSSVTSSVEQAGEVDSRGEQPTRALANVVVSDGRVILPTTRAESDLHTLFRTNLFPLKFQRKCYELFPLWPELYSAASRAGSQQVNPEDISIGSKYDWDNHLHFPVVQQIMNDLVSRSPPESHIY